MEQSPNAKKRNSGMRRNKYLNEINLRGKLNIYLNRDIPDRRY
jgi:hypothetical protein